MAITKLIAASSSSVDASLLTGDLPAISGASLTGIQGVNTGIILPFGDDTLPTGFLYCDGSAISRTTYADLFAAISTTWGTGDGSTTFNVPNLKGAYLRGIGDGTINSRTKSGGANVGTFQEDALERHSHFYRFADGAGVTTAPNGGSGHYVNSTVNSSQYQGKYTDNFVYSGRENTSETRVYNAGVKYMIKT